MDYKKLNSHILLFILVECVILVFAIFARLIAIRENIDDGTANLIFIATIVILTAIHLIILSTLANSFIPWLLKKLPFRPQKQVKSNKTQTEQPIISVEEEISEQEYEAVRLDYERNYLNKITEKIKTFQEYTNLVFAPHISKNELLQLHKYIICYVREESLPSKMELIQIKANKLKNIDLFHFGWNMAHFFEKEKQEVVPWLQNVFINLQGLEFSYIKGKLYDSKVKGYAIPNIKDIPEYIAEQGK